MLAWNLLCCAFRACIGPDGHLSSGASGELQPRGQLTTYEQLGRTLLSPQLSAQRAHCIRRHVERYAAQMSDVVLPVAREQRQALARSGPVRGVRKCHVIGCSSPKTLGQDWPPARQVVINSHRHFVVEVFAWVLRGEVGPTFLPLPGCIDETVQRTFLGLTV